MSSELRKSFERKKSLSTQLSQEQLKQTDLVTAYLVLADHLMGEKDELVFRSPDYSGRARWGPQDVRIKLKNHTVEKKRSDDTVRTEPLDEYLKALGSPPPFSNDGFDKAIEDIEKSPINERITPKMLNDAYNRFITLKEGTLRIYAVRKLIDFYRTHPLIG